MQTYFNQDEFNNYRELISDNTQLVKDERV